MRPRLFLVLAGMLLTAQPSMGGDVVVTLAVQGGDP